MRRPRGRRIAILVGAFVVVFGGFAVFVSLFLGSAVRIFTQRARLHARFSDVTGLRRGAEVRISGVVVGTVSGIHLAEIGATGAVVDLELKRRVAAGLHADATAELKGSGLLGDQSVNLDPGHASQALPEDAVIPGHIPPSLHDLVVDLERVSSGAHDTIDQMHKLAEEATHAVASLNRPEIGDNLVATTQALRDYTAALDRGPGLMRALARDPRLARELRRTLRQADSATRKGEQAMARVDGAATGVKDVVDHVHSGRGTLGGLVYDPMVYQNLSAITGNVRRSFLLRTLTRFALKHRHH